MRAVTFIITTMLLILTAGCAGGNQNDGNNAPVEYKKLTARQAKSLMDEGEPYILLDVRTDEEYKEIRIDGAVLIPDMEIKDRAETELPDKDAVILVYCRSGRRSEIVARELLDMGYTNVYDFGGIIDWSYETVSG